jgi:Outer membrane protein beta-barrel domain
MFRKLITSLIAIPMVLAVSAQGNHTPAFSDELFGLSWDINIPVNNNFTNKTSLDGFQMDYRKMIKPDLSVGLEINWASYEQYYPRKTYQIPNGAVTTDFYSYLYTFPLAISVHHYFHGNNKIFPYAGLALGATYAEMKLFYNTYSSSDYNWGFLIRPELGAIVKFSDNSSWGLMIGARYNYSTNTQSNFKINGIQSVGFQLGLVATK